MIPVVLSTCVAIGATVFVELIDAETGLPSPARVELLDREGNPHIPPEALIVQQECNGDPIQNTAPGCLVGFTYEPFIDNPHTGTRQFYVARDFSIDLPPGSYRLRVFRGIETRVISTTLEIDSDATQHVRFTLERWIDMRARHWYGADDHLHIARYAEDDNGYLASWLKGEDIHIANLLQMGNSQAFDVTPQYDFGPSGVYQDRDILLLSGQEHPRTHVFGHSITLGPKNPIDLRDQYLLYEAFWKLARAAGGVNGSAHWGLGPARLGLAVFAPSRLLSFVEVLQMEFAHYEVWYELLNLGLRVAPTAGTDFPCGEWSVPGRERFYTRVDGPLTRESWLTAVEEGRTFVTNGPMLEFAVDHATMGDILHLAQPGAVNYSGVVWFDPTRDDIRKVELIVNGRATDLTPTRIGESELRVEGSIVLEHTSWLALRVSGDKVGEAPISGGGYSELALSVAESFAAGVSMKERWDAIARANVRPSAAHTAAVTVRVGDEAVGPRARDAARDLMSLLHDLEAKLDSTRIGKMGLELGGMPNSDSVSVGLIAANRSELLKAIREAKQYYRRILAE